MLHLGILQGNIHNHLFPTLLWFAKQVSFLLGWAARRGTAVGQASAGPGRGV